MDGMGGQFEPPGYFEDAYGFEAAPRRDVQEPHYVSNWLGTSDSPWTAVGVNNHANALNTTSAPKPSPTSNMIHTSGNFSAFQGWRNNPLPPSDCETVPGDSGYGSYMPSNFDNSSIQGDDRVNASIPEVETEFNGFHLNSQDTHASRANFAISEPGATEFLPASSPTEFPKICTDCKVPVRTKSEMNKHLQRHKKPHVCPYPDCGRKSSGFASNNDLVRHKRTVHGEIENGRTFICRRDACGKKDPKLWPRADNFRSHLLRVHKLKVKAEDDLREYVYQPHQQQLQGLEGIGTKLQDHDPMNEQNTETGRAPRTPSITEFPEIAAPVPSTTHRQATSRVFDCDLLMPPPSLSSRPRYGGPHAGPQRISHAFQDLEDQKSGQSPPAGPVFGDQFNHRGPMPIQHMSHNVDHMMQTAPDPIPQPPMMMMAMNPTASIASDNDSDEEGKDSQESGLESSAHSSESMNNKLRDLPKADHPDVMDYLITLPKDVLQKALDSHSQSSPDAPNDNSTSGSKAKTECVTCAKTFNRPCELRKHSKRHEKPYGCTWYQCDRTFGSKNDWKRHETNQHGQIETWHCGYSCTKFFNRREDFQNHLQKTHRITDSAMLERNLEESRRGMHCTDSFWCGFCKDLRSVTPGDNVAHKRFDHVDDHFMGRCGIKKQRVGEWLYVEQLADEDNYPTTNKTPTASPDHEVGRKRKRNLPNEWRPSKQTHR